MMLEVVTSPVAQAEPLLGQSETKVIPALTIAERYDSNIFFIPGKHLEDYVTTVTPELKVNHSGRLVTGNIVGALSGEAYVKNPGLNYIGTSAGINLDLSNLVGLIDRRARLTVGDNFMYTPKPLAFIGPDTGSQVPDAFVRGIQAARANSKTNMTTVGGSYEITPVASFQATYMRSTMEFGNILATPSQVGSSAPSQGSFFSTTFQTLNAGPQFQVTPLDSLSLNYQRMRSDFTLQGGSASSFETQGATLGWNRILTPRLKASVNGGITLLGSGSTSSLQYQAAAVLEWKYENGVAILNYSRSVFPSFFIVPLPLLSQLVSASASYNIAGNLSGIATVSYAKNESIPTPILTYESYSVTLSLNYSITRAVSAIATASHSEFNQGFSGSQQMFSRNVVSLSLRGEWN